MTLLIQRSALLAWRFESLAARSRLSRTMARSSPRFANGGVSLLVGGRLASAQARRELRARQTTRDGSGTRPRGLSCRAHTCLGFTAAHWSFASSRPSRSSWSAPSRRLRVSGRHNTHPRTWLTRHPLRGVSPAASGSPDPSGSDREACPRASSVPRRTAADELELADLDRAVGLVRHPRGTRRATRGRADHEAVVGGRDVAGAGSGRLGGQLDRDLLARVHT